jgi:hypothetical protein
LEYVKQQRQAEFHSAPKESEGKTLIGMDEGEEVDSESSGGLGRGSWELFSQVGVREDSL